jgi:hypothetical protein
MNWVISFPESGNQGRKYLYYAVLFSDLKKAGSEIQTCLVDILDNSAFENKVPHTVGFFKESVGELIDNRSTYLEIRIIRSIEEFWKFLNDLDL